VAWRRWAWENSCRQSAGTPAGISPAPTDSALHSQNHTPGTVSIRRHSLFGAEHRPCMARRPAPPQPLQPCPGWDFARIAHADALHYGARTHVVADRAGHHGARTQDVERKRQPGATNLRRVAAPPELAPQRPSDLKPVRVRNERVTNLMHGAHPRLCRKEPVDLTPVVIDLRTRQTAAADNLATPAVVRDPLVDAMEAPRVAHELGPLLRLLEARLLIPVPRPHLVITVHTPQIMSVGGSGRFKPQPHREPRFSDAAQRRGFFHAPSVP
jgi:hypothetical protein